MKSRIVLLVIVLSSSFACQPDTPAKSDDLSISEANAFIDPVHIKSEKAAVLVGLWHYAVTVGKPEEVSLYDGRWIDLQRDDTFTSGQWLEETNSGTWSYEDEGNYLRLIYNNNENLATEWQTQGSGTTVIWKGSTPNNPSAIQIKMEKNLENARPGK